MVRETCLSETAFLSSCLWIYPKHISIYAYVGLEISQKNYCIMSSRDLNSVKATGAQDVRLVDTWCLEDYLVEGERRMLSPA
jgi:hypothetical protein